MRFVRCKTTSGYEAMILTPEQAYAILLNLREPERTLTLLAAGTGLRISECLGLQWQDINFAERNDPRASHLDVWPSRFAEEQSIEVPGATASFAGRLHASLETEDDVFPDR